MSLTYLFAWDFARIGAAALRATDDGGSFVVRFEEGTFSHVDLSSVVPGYTAFADALEAALNAGSSGIGTWSVTALADGANGYQFDYSDTVSLSFDTGVTAAEGKLMQQILGFGSANPPASDQISSDDGTTRPWYVIIPATQGRSQVSDEYEPDDVASEDVTDGGDTADISPDEPEIWLDWEQVGEDLAELPVNPYSPGAPVMKRHESTVLPWSYQRAWEHHQRGFDPFVVVEGSERSVHRLRAEGAAWRPVRMAQDYPMWTVPFRTRLLGRLP